MGTLGRRFIAWRRSVMFLVVVLATAFGLLPSMAQASSSGEVAALLHEIRSLSERALAAANAASEAATIAEVKAGADSVYRIMWGIPSGLAEDGANGAEVAHGWKERWQTDE